MLLQLMDSRELFILKFTSGNDDLLTIIMALGVSHEEVLASFDKLASQGIIQYGPSQIVALVDDDFAVSTTRNHLTGQD